MGEQWGRGLQVVWSQSLIEDLLDPNPHPPTPPTPDSKAVDISAKDGDASGSAEGHGTGEPKELCWGRGAGALDSPIVSSLDRRNGWLWSDKASLL